MILLAVVAAVIGQASGERAVAGVGSLAGLGLGGKVSVAGYGAVAGTPQPLSLTVIGLALLGMIFARRLRRGGPPSVATVWWQAARVTIVYLVMIIIVVIAGNVAQRSSGRGLDVGSTFLYGLMWLAITLGIAIAAGVPETFSGKGQQVRGVVVGILKGLWLILWLSTAATVTFLVVEYVRADFNPFRDPEIWRNVAITVLVFLPNLGLHVLFVGLGIPVNVGMPILDQSRGGTQSVLWLLVEARPIYWLMPAAAAVIVFLGALRTARYARRHGVRFGGLAFALAFPVILALVSLVVAFTGLIPAQSIIFSSTDLDFSLLYTLLAGVAWGAVLGVLAGWLTPSPPAPPRAPAYPNPVAYAAPPGYAAPPSYEPGQPLPVPPPATTAPINLAAVQAALFCLGLVLIAVLALVTKP